MIDCRSTVTLGKVRWAYMVLAAGMLGPLVPARAHPLGPESVDHYSQLEVTPKKIIVIYDIDMAEVATFQQMKRLDANGDGVADDAERKAFAEAIAREQVPGLHLEVNGRALPLKTTGAKAYLQPGQTALPTLRILLTIETAPGSVDSALAGGGPQAGIFRNDNDPNRIGWRQMGVRGLGTQIVDQSVNGRLGGVSPQGFAMDQGGDQTNTREVGFRFLPVAGRSNGSSFESPALATPQPIAPRPRELDSFAALMTAQRLTPLKMWWFLILAAALGGVHALSPGHGKTLVAAYLVGSRGTARHALFLGLIVTFTHTAGVFALGLVTLFASRYLLPDTLYPWLTAGSGLVIAQVGLLRLLGRGGFHDHDHDQHAHDHDHDHEHHQAHAHNLTHSHAAPPGGHVHEHAHHSHDHDHGGGHAHTHLPAVGQAITWRSLAALGVSGGLVPCPSALVVLLSAVALHQIGFGLALIVAFSAGLAAVLTMIGIVMVHARDFVGSRFAVPPWVLRLVPRVGAALITVIGLAIAAPAVVIIARRF